MIASLVASLCLASHTGAQNVLANPGFEPPAENGLAQSWANNTWGDCETRFSLDETNPHGGKTSQRIECVRRSGGASQFLQPLSIQAGKLYRVKLWVRAEGNVPWVGACLRQRPEPYRHHVRGEIEPGRDWELLEFEGVPLDDEEQAGLFIWFEADGSGTVWVDDASVEVTDPSAPVGPPPEGNVIPNGSFEVDPTRTWDNVGEPIDWPSTGGVAHGKRSLHCKLSGKGRFGLRTPCLEFNGADEEFTLACSARATGGPVTLEVAVRSAMQVKQGSDLLRLTATPEAGLRRFWITGKLPPSLNGAYFVSVAAHTEAPAEVWLDAISLSREGPDFAPAAPLEAALSARAFAGILAPDEPKRVRLELFNDGPAFRGTATLTVRDFAENAVFETPLPIEIASGELSTKDLSLPLKRLGAFRADVGVGEGPPLASMVFSVIPPPAKTTPAQSIVGGHFATNSDWQMQVARRLGYKWTRIHDCSSITHWATAEPEPGDWRFFDEDVRRVKQAGLEILGEFLRVPKWATTAAPDSEAFRNGVGPFRDMAEFEAYVRTVVAHYKSDIHYWEIWNEPYGSGFWGGTAEQYADLAQVACRAAKAEDPACQLLAPCLTPYAPEWATRALGAGAISQADLFSYHGYGCLTKSQYDRVNEWATRDGTLLARWNTETGVTAKTFYRHVPDRLDDSYTRWIGGVPVEEAVTQSLKLFVLAMASGADRYFYYWTNVEAGMCPRMTSMSIYEFDRTIRPHGVVYAIAGTLLDPCKGAGVRELRGGTVCCLLQREGEAVAVLWAKTKSSSREAKLTGLPAQTRALDSMGNPTATAKDGALRVEIGKLPVYLIAEGARTEELAGALSK
ncbi:MAG: hypothetical protein FJX75_12845 [Armatimonadetes bacterium]|nr:hypothetical protein [Armatimonadota bacterium]